MAINNTTGSFPFMEFPMAFSRQDSFPLDKTSVYGSLEAAQTYAQTNPTAYVGQVISVVENGTSTIYQIKDAAGTLEPMGTGDLDGDVESIISANTASTENINEMIGEVYQTSNEESDEG